MEPRVWWLATVLVAVVLCFLPLTSLLGYEASAAMGVVLGIASMRLTTLELRTALKSSSSAFGSTSNRVDPVQHPLAWWLSRLGPRLLLTVPPAVVLLLNALRVKNCDPLGGVVFWALIPMVSVLFGHALVLVTTRLTGSARAGLLLGLGVVGFDTLWFFVRLVVQPPITGVHTLFGYFAGSIYDEALSIPRPLLWYRLLVVLGSVTGVLLLEAAERWKQGRSRRETLWALAAFGGASLFIAGQAESIGFWLEREDIAEELGASVESEHFVLHYDPAALSAEEIDAMVADHEYRYAELMVFFDENPIRDAGRPLHSFVYPGREAQQRLFGSRNTFVARPWTYEMHIRWSKPGDTAVAHELAHLFTAPFGGGPLSLATDGGLFVHLGLVEGIALAADWPPSELTPHEAAAAMRTLEIAPDLRMLFEPSGFWSQPSGKAYTLMGSFVRWLVDTRGIDKFKEVYAYGDWEGVYGTTTDALVSDWETFVDTYNIDDSRLELARFKYSRNTIFKKVCARSIAELRRQSNNAERRGDHERALELQREILSFQKGTPEPGLEIARLLVELERWDEATAAADELLAREGPRALKPKTRAEVEELRADILWRAGRRADAAKGYENCLGWGLSDSERRTLGLKLRGTTTDDDVEGAFVFQYLFETTGRTSLLWTALQWQAAAPEDPLVRYLIGFQLSAAKLQAAAIPYLEGPPGTLASRELDEQRQILWARALQDAQRFDEALAVWIRLFNAHSSRVRLLAVEGADRVRYEMGQPLASHPRAP